MVYFDIFKPGAFLNNLFEIKKWLIELSKADFVQLKKQSILDKEIFVCFI